MAWRSAGMLGYVLESGESCLVSVEILAQGFITSNTLAGYAMFCGASRSAVERVALVSEKLLARDLSAAKPSIAGRSKERRSEESSI